MTRGPLLRVEPEMRGIERGVSFRPGVIRITLPPTAVAPVPGASWPLELPAVEAQLLAALNGERAKVGGLAPFVSNPHVQASIGFYVREMAEFQFMSHDSPDEPGYPAMPWYQRLYLFGSPTSAALGENLAYGFVDVKSVVAAWMSDEGHRANILNDSWIGVGCGVCQASNGLIFWGNDFTSERLGPAPAPKITAVTPLTGKVGDPVVITGSGFDATADAKFNAVLAPLPEHWTATTYPTSVPAGATTGPVTVDTQTGGIAVGPVFTVTGSPPPPPPGPTPPAEGQRRQSAAGTIVEVHDITAGQVGYQQVTKKGKLGPLKHQAVKAFEKKYPTVVS